MTDAGNWPPLIPTLVDTPLLPKPHRDSKLHRVQVLTRFSVKVTRSMKEPTMTLSLANVLVAVPPGRQLAKISGLDLPIAGMISVTPAQITSGLVVGMPYVGDVELIGDLDTFNVAIDEAPGGLFIRGNVSFDTVCTV